MIMSDETIDSLFDESFRLIQDKRGYRFSIDPILLAYFARIKEGERVVDLGTGNGIIALLLSKLSPASLFLAVEIQPGLADQALRNSILNKVDKRVLVLQENLQNLPHLFQKGSFDVVISNPPYRASNSGRINLNPNLAGARHEILTSIETLILVASDLLKNGGKAYFMFPSFRLSELISLLKKYHLEPKILQLVYSSMRSESQHFLIQGCKNCRMGLRILPPLILYKEKGVASEAHRNIYHYFQEKIS